MEDLSDIAKGIAASEVMVKGVDLALDSYGGRVQASKDVDAAKLTQCLFSFRQSTIVKCTAVVNALLEQGLLGEGCTQARAVEKAAYVASGRDACGRFDLKSLGVRLLLVGTELDVHEGALAVAGALWYPELGVV